MQTNIEVKSRREGDAIRRGLDRPDVRALALIIGELAGLPDDRTRKRVLHDVIARLEEDDAAQASGDAKA